MGDSVISLLHHHVWACRLFAPFAPQIPDGRPALPIPILHNGLIQPMSKSGVGVNTIIALEHNDNRVFDKERSDVPNWQLERFVVAMRKPFPQQTSLDIDAAVKESFWLSRTPPQVFPDSFLGRPQSLRLDLHQP
jgi:hypothetical protein